MGISVSYCKVKIGYCSCLGNARQLKIFEVMKPDGKPVESSKSICVKDEPRDAEAANICPLKVTSQHQQPSPSSEKQPGGAATARRIKVTITRQQLQALLNKQLSLEEVVKGLQKKKNTKCYNINEDLSANWRPNLETIQEA